MMGTSPITWRCIVHNDYPAQWKLAAKNTLAGSCMMNVSEGILVMLTIAINNSSTLIGTDPTKAALMMVSKHVAQFISFLCISYSSSTAFANAHDVLSFNRFYRAGALLHAEQCQLFLIQLN